jgi:thiol-disulfide isomerase/thioredoxin
MANTAKQTKRLRQRERAEARAAALRRQEQRRRLAIVLGGLALVAVVVLAVFAFMGGSEEEGAGASTSTEVVAGGPPRTEPLGQGEAVPSFSAPGLDGGTVAWADYAGAPAVLAVWAPWCPHCQTELPVLDSVMREFPDVGFLTLVTWIGDQPGPAPDVYMRENDLAFPVAVDDQGDTIAAGLGVMSTPTLYFVSSDGTVAQTMTGEVDAETLREAVGSLS